MRARGLAITVLAVAFVLLMGVRYGLGSTWTRAGLAAVAGVIVGVVICIAAARGKKGSGAP